MKLNKNVSKEIYSVKKVKPFGLSIAVKVALEAIQNFVAPTSVILSNLFSLQKSKVFPKDLTVDYFKNPYTETTDIEKKAIMVLLEEFKKPGVKKQNMLEDLLEPYWIKKKPQMAVPNKSVLDNKPKKRMTNSSHKKNDAETLIFVKKSKLSY